MAPVSLHLLALLLATGLVSSSSSSSNSINSATQELLRCLQQDCSGRPTAWEDFAGGQVLPCLHVEQVWWSRRQAHPALPLTLVTQLSADRLRQLRAQCDAYLGPLSAAVHVRLVAPNGGGGTAPDAAARERLTKALRDVDRLFAATEAAGRCQLRLMLVSETYRSAQASMLYPVNTLRNYARLLAGTPLIANVDVDMLPSASLSVSLQQPAAAEAYARGCAAGAVYVIPAFQTYCGNHHYADQLTAYSKAQLGALQAQPEGCVGQFRGRAFPPGHAPTDYTRWFASNKAYRVEYALTFEPWFLSDRRSTQWYDARFRGYGKNKIVGVAATAAANGGQFWVHPDGFLVHRPHPQSESRKSFMQAKAKKPLGGGPVGGIGVQQPPGPPSVYEVVERLWNESLADMADGTYRVPLDAPVSSCLGRLSWWKDGPGAKDSGG